MVTAFYAGIIAFMLIALSVNVIKGRRLHGAGIGDAENMDLRRRIRAQANLAEYAPLFLILTGFAEQGGLSPWAVHTLCLAFLFGRIMHAYSLLYAEAYEAERLVSNPIWRIGGMILTFTTIGILGMIMLAQSI